MKPVAFFCMALMCGLSLSQAESASNASTSLVPKPTQNTPLAPGATIGAIPSQPGAPFRPTKTSPNAITPQEWQELSAARASAMKANPALMQRASELSTRMRAFQQKLDAAIVRVDPNTSSIIDRLEHGGPPSARPMMLPQGQHPPSPAFPAAVPKPSDTQP